MSRGEILDLPGVPIPVNDEARLAALQFCNILDTPPEPVFDRLTDLASAIFDVPISLVSLVDKDRQWFKSAVGLEVTQTSRRDSFCAHAILEDQIMVVRDTLEDPRFANNALVIGAPFIRFYAGAPLVTFDGFRLGTLCIVDKRPRPNGLSPKELDILRDLARVTTHEIDSGRAASQQVDSLREQLQQTGAAKQNFLRMMSHELRTPLNAIIGFSELIKLREQTAEATEQTDYAARIAHAGRHLLTMIESVLEWARVECGELRLEEREVALGEPIRAALALLPDSDGRVELKACTEKVHLKCDSGFVTQVLANIVGNALNHCANDTAITLSTEWSEGEPLVVQVVDRGPGMCEDEIRDVLEAFEHLGDQFSKKHGGLGLGLVISRKLMELHGGQLRLRASPGEGTTVELVFPACRCRAA